MDTSTSKNAKKKKFSQTRQLINLALNDSWTQTEIAKACRVHQSVVSGWKNGATKATESQLTPLLEIYGHKLRRNSFRVYWTKGNESQEDRFFKVEGKVILSHALTDARRNGAKLIKKVPVRRLIVHDQGKGMFRVIVQNRFIFTQSREELESSQDDAVWASDISEQLDVPTLLTFVQSYCESHAEEYTSDATTLPFLIRKALLNHGHNVEGVVEYPAVW